MNLLPKFFQRIHKNYVSKFSIKAIPFIKISDEKHDYKSWMIIFEDYFLKTHTLSLLITMLLTRLFYFSIQDFKLQKLWPITILVTWLHINIRLSLNLFHPRFTYSGVVRQLRNKRR